jgi:hypothetical protein
VSEIGPAGRGREVALGFDGELDRGDICGGVEGVGGGSEDASCGGDGVGVAAVGDVRI